MNVLEVKGLVVRYGSGRNTLVAVDGVDLAIPKGKTLGLVGESGCGKSTIARALVGLAPVLRGTVTLDGVDCSSHAARNAPAYRRRVQMVFQDPYSSLNPRMSIGECLDEAVRMRGDEYQDARVRRKEIARLLDLVRLPANTPARYPHQFSGGQRQRIAIARALAVAPEVLINDEVTSALDVSVQATILNLLQELQRELGISYLLISHDLSVVYSMSHVIAVMYLGRIVETTETVPLYRDPAHPYTAALLDSVPTFAAERKPAAISGDLPDPRDPPDGCRFHTRCPVGPLAIPERTICAEQDPQERAHESVHLAACHFAGERVPTYEERRVAAAPTTRSPAPSPSPPAARPR